MEKLFFRRIEVWIAALIVLVVFLGMFAFAVMVRDRAYGNNTFGALGRASLAVASLPANATRDLRTVLRGDLTGMVTPHSDRFEGRGGWTFFESRLASGLDGYLLFSRQDGDAGHHVLELVDLKAGKTVHRIDVDSAVLLADAQRGSRFASLDNWRPERFQAVHPLALDNGDILVKGFRAPIARMNPCGQPVWVQDKYTFHHSIEPGPDGHFWTSSYVEPQQAAGVGKKFLDPGLVQFSADGEILFDRSLTDAMIRQGLGYLIFSYQPPNDDPLHLNDVQPVFEDGPYWKRGDVFLSLRHIATIMQYRPSTDEIIWWKQGPWSAQHDVDVIDDTTISVFNNNVYNLYGGGHIDGHSKINYYDFATDTVSEPFRDALEGVDFRNEAAGTFTLLPGGHYYVDESESGRTLIFTPDGELAVEHINRAQNGLIYHLGWSRYMDRAAGDGFLARLKAADCG